MTTEDRITTRRRAAATRAMLAGGAIAGPLFIVVSLAQAFTREGFDLRTHAFSMLSLGDLGWLQVVNFVVCGALFAIAGVGALRVVRDRGRRGIGAMLLIAFGIGHIGGGMFVADPAYGFPIGTTVAGAPTDVSWHGTAHAIAFAVGMLSLVLSGVAWSRDFRAAHDTRWAVYSGSTALAFVVLAGVGIVTFDFRIVAVAVIVGWCWASLLCLHLRSSVHP